MIKMRLQVDSADGTSREVSVRPVTQVAFERHYGVGLSQLSTDLKLEWVYWLAWDAIRKLGEKPPEFDPWLAQIESVEILDDEDDDPKARSSV